VKKIIIITILIFSANIFAVDKSIFSEIPEDDSVQTFNPFKLASLSLIPGGGQLATKHFTKGFLFLGSEGIIGWIAVRQRQDYHKSYQNIYRWQDSLSTKRNDAVSPSDTIKWKAWVRDTMYSANKIAQAEFDMKLNRARFYNASALFGAVGIWNLLDAIGISGHVSGVENPNPRTAMALSAIPFSGAGQFYNGEWFKAGLVIATQTAFVFGGTQFQIMMRKSEKYREELATDSNFLLLDRVDRNDVWRDRYRNAAQRRTMFFWYSVIFYIYGMTDAYVDASLHNFNKKFDITADFDPIDNGVAVGFTWKF